MRISSYLSLSFFASKLSSFLGSTVLEASLVCLQRELHCLLQEKDGEDLFLFVLQTSFRLFGLILSLRITRNSD